MTQRRLIGAIIAVGVALFLFFPLLLYAYRSQTPAIPSVPITQAVQEIQQGRVSEVTIEGNKATLTLTDGAHETTFLPDNSATNPIGDAVAAWNRSNPQRQILLRFQSPNGGSNVLTVVLSVVLSLLPLVLFIVFIVLIVLVAVALMRARSPNAYERLARAADLRDRGVLTEDEFQLEKKKILR
jgi:ATP-dependent Zn protease